MASKSNLTRVLHQAVVVDVFSNPSQLTTKQINLLRSRVGNSDYCEKMPRNSIMGITLDSDGTAALDSQPVILYPFFSGHLAMPIKPGERVFVIYENANSPKEPIGNGVLGYWITRVSANINIDDINYTCHERTPPIQAKTSGMDTFEGTTPEGVPDFPNGPGPVENRVLKNPSGFEEIVKSAYAFRNVDNDMTVWEAKIDQSNPILATEFTGEPVPRFSKGCADLSIQGSNNTLIALTEEPSTRSPGGGEIFGAGLIDIVAGRGFGPDNAVEPIVNSRAYAETDKDVSVAQVSEGQIDFMNDLSRVYVSMKSSPDDIFGLTSIFSSGDAVISTMSSVIDKPTIVLKTDEIRLIAREEGSIRMVKPGIPGAELNLLSDSTICMDGSEIYIGRTAGLTDQPVMRGKLLELALHNLANAISAAIGGDAFCGNLGAPLTTGVALDAFLGVGEGPHAIGTFKGDVTNALSETVFVK